MIVGSVISIGPIITVNSTDNSVNKWSMCTHNHMLYSIVSAVIVVIMSTVMIRGKKLLIWEFYSVVKRIQSLLFAVLVGERFQDVR